MYGMNLDALTSKNGNKSLSKPADFGYKVKKGDTLYSLSKKFNMSVEQFKKFTGLSGGLSLDANLNVPQVKLTTSFSALAAKYNMTESQLLDINPQLKNKAANAKKNTLINVPKEPFEKRSSKTSSVSSSDSAVTESSIQSFSHDPEERIVLLKNGKKISAGALHKEMLAKAPKGAERPHPVINEKGEICAEVKIIEPHLEGFLSGKTIIVNAGHGGYNPNNGAFDAGTHAKNETGRTVEEWEKNREFALELIPKLTMKGAKVIFISGSAASVADAKKKYKSADMFISLHCDSSVKTQVRGQTVLYAPTDKNNKQLADTMKENIAKHPHVDPDSCRMRPDNRGLAVLNASPLMPSVLIETGFQSNPQDLKNIESREYRNTFAGLVSESVEDYFAQKDIKKYKLHTNSDVLNFTSPAKEKAPEKSEVSQNNNQNRLKDELRNIYLSQANPTDFSLKDELRKIYAPETTKKFPNTSFAKRAVHKVKSGETLSGLEKRYGLLQGELTDYNKLENTALAVGQQLKIPEHVKASNIRTKNDAADAVGLSSEFLSELERVEGKNYSMNGNKPTIGVGHYPFTNFEKIYYKEKKVSDEEIYTLLAKDITKAQAKIKAEIGVEAYDRLSQKQKEAIVDFVFNRGETIFRSKDCDELRKALINGDYDTAAINIKHNLDYKTKKVKCGLCRRRLQEMARFCDGNFSPKVLKGAQKLYEDGINAARSEGLPKHVIDDYSREILELFDNKLTARK